MRFFSLFLLFCFLFIESETIDCPFGTYQVPNEDVCLYFFSEYIFYTEVIHRCESFGAIPVKIQNIFENAYIVALWASMTDFAGLDPYIGLEREVNNEWLYDDGTPVVYRNWALNEPNNSSNTSVCATIDQSGKWHSAECSFARPFICSSNGNVQPTSIDLTSTSTSTKAPPKSCPDGWAYYGNTNQCYYLQNFTYPDGGHWALYNWATAEERCQKMGAHLVSIHSKNEDDFVYDLIFSNVVNLTDAAPKDDPHPCVYQWIWIGLYNNNGTIGNGKWTDGSPVDYNGFYRSYECPYYWKMSNDPSCVLKDWGTVSAPVYSFARFVCKMPSNKRVERKRFGEKLEITLEN